MYYQVKKLNRNIRRSVRDLVSVALLARSPRDLQVQLDEMFVEVRLLDRRLDQFRAPAPAPEVKEVPFELDVMVEGQRCKALLLEILKRAANDWVLYRNSSKLPLRQQAEECYVWLFEEEPGHPWWKERIKNKRYITSFLGICETVDIEPEAVRAYVRRLTKHDIMSVGRPAENRQHDTSAAVEHSLIGGGGELADFTSSLLQEGPWAVSV